MADITYTWNPGDGNMTIRGQNLGDFLSRRQDTLLLGGNVAEYRYWYGEYGQYLLHVPTGSVISLLDTHSNSVMGDVFYAPPVAFIRMASDNSLFARPVLTTYTGSALADEMLGGPENNVLIGGLGADIIHGGNGDDDYVWNIGDGNDTFQEIQYTTLGLSLVARRTATDTVTTGFDEIVFGAGVTEGSLRFEPTGTLLRIVHISGAVITVIDYKNFEQLRFADGTALSLSSVPLSGTAVNDVILGGPGVDQIRGGDGNDVLAGYDTRLSQTYTTSNLLDGEDGNDTLIGDDGNDQLIGGAGADTLYGHLGADTLTGGDGNDLLYADAGDDTVDGGGGDDTIYASAGLDTAAGGDGSDTLVFDGVSAGLVLATGTGVVSFVIAQGTFNTGAGTATYSSIENLTGGSGDDTLSGDAGDNRLHGGSSGSDTVSFAAVASAVAADLSRDGPQATGQGNDTFLSIENLIGGAGNDRLLGYLGSNRLDGRDGVDWLDGGAGDDTLLGGEGADMLIGGLGTDTLTGGLGADRFAFKSNGVGGADTITDFELGTDRIDLIGMGVTGFASFVSAIVDTAEGATVTLGSGGSTQTILVQGVAAAQLTANQFLVGSLASNDFNADGRSDLVFRNAGGVFAQWQFTPGGFAANAYVDDTVSADWKIAAQFDFDGDSRADLLFNNTTTGDITIWNATDSGFARNVYVDGVASDFGVAGTGDFNGDGRDDLIFRSKTTGLFTQWNSTGSGFDYNAYMDGTVDPSWRIQTIADFNGDGKADLLFRNSFGVFTEWQSTGAGFKQNVYKSASVDPTWHIAAAADFSGDGKADLLFRNDNGAFTIWQSTGDGFTPNVYARYVDPVWNLSSGFDFNSDGMADLLFRGPGGTLTIWQSYGDGFFPNVLIDNQADASFAVVQPQYDLV